MTQTARSGGLEGLRVLITDGSSELGRAAAQAFLSAGATVAISGKPSPDFDAAIRGSGGSPRLIAAPADLTVAQERSRAITGALTALAGLDVLVNNAGAGSGCRIDEVTEEFWRQTLDVQLKALFFTAQLCIPELRKTRGAIINVSSSSGLIGAPAGSVVYATAQGAVVQMTRMLALALAADGVRVNALCLEPPGTSAAEVPLRRCGTPAETTGAVLYFASPLNSYTTGAILSVDGGVAAGR